MGKGGHFECCQEQHQHEPWSVQKIKRKVGELPANLRLWTNGVGKQFNSWLLSLDFFAFFGLVGVAFLLPFHGHDVEDFKNFLLSFHPSLQTLSYSIALTVSFFCVPHFYLLFVVDFLMFFGPTGHFLTVGGRHEGGGKTWFLVKRVDAFIFHVLHCLFIWLLGKMMRNQRPVEIKLIAMLMNWLAKITGVRALKVKAERVVASTVSLTAIIVSFYFGFRALVEGGRGLVGYYKGTNGTELPVLLHQFYLCNCLLQFAWSVTMILNKTTPNLKSNFETYPPTYWFWGLVLYYCPSNALWLPIVMECIRMSVTSYCRMFNYDMPLVGPISAIPEVLQFIFAVSQLRTYPIVLWLRLPNLASACVMLSLDIVRRLTWARHLHTKLANHGHSHHHNDKNDKNNEEKNDVDRRNNVVSNESSAGVGYSSCLTSKDGVIRLLKTLYKGAFGLVDSDEMETVTMFVLLKHPALSEVSPQTKSMRLPPHLEDIVNAHGGKIVEPLVIERGSVGEVRIPGQWLVFQTSLLFGEHTITVEKEGQFKVLHPVRDITKDLEKFIYGKGTDRYLAKRYSKDPLSSEILPTELEKNRIVRQYFGDVLIQELTAYYANKYSELDVPCKVELVKTCVMERTGFAVFGGGAEQNNMIDVGISRADGSSFVTSACMTPGQYKNDLKFAAEVERALNSMPNSSLKFRVTVVTRNEFGPFCSRFNIAADGIFELKWFGGPSGAAAEKAGELIGFDYAWDYVGQKSYEGNMNPAHGFYLLEKCMEGYYTKYNNNSFWPTRIDLAAGRDTPWAFTHFSYLHSNRSLVICDIQGVGDYYTDPQIHTNDPALQKYVYNSAGFWDPRGLGMAAVLTSHRETCAKNEICASLNLTNFWWEGELPERVKEQIDAIREANHRRAHEDAARRRKEGYIPENSGVSFRHDFLGGATPH